MYKKLFKLTTIKLERYSSLFTAYFCDVKIVWRIIGHWLARHRTIRFLHMKDAVDNPVNLSYNKDKLQLTTSLRLMWSNSALQISKSVTGSIDDDVWCLMNELNMIRGLANFSIQLFCFNDNQSQKITLMVISVQLL